MWKSKPAIIIWVLLIGYISAFSSVAEAQDFETYGTFEIFGFEALCVVNDYAFIGTNYSDIIILDISDKNNPLLVTQFDTPFYGHTDIKVRDNYLYLASNDNFAVFDITDIENPVLFGSCFITHGAGMAIQGDYAYITLHQHGFKVIDISDPSNPTIVGQNPSQSKDVEVVGDYAYLAAYGDVHILDISDPTDPTVVGSISANGGSQSIFVQNDLAFVAVGDSGFTIIDVSAPANPVILSATPTLDRAEAINVKQDFAFISDDGAGITLFNISDPANPEYITTFIPIFQEMATVLQNGYYTYYVSQFHEYFGICRFTGLGSGVLTGTVSNQYGDPLEGTIVSALNTPFADTTDTDGEYFMEGFYTDLHDIEFSHPYYGDSLIAGFSITTGDTAILNVVLESPSGIDVGVSSIVSPVDSVEFGQEHDLVVEVTNHGLNPQTFDVYIEIYYADSSELLLADTATVNNMPEMSAEMVYFSETFTPERFKSYDVVSYTALPGDENTANDTSFALCYGYKPFPPLEEISSTWFPYGLNFIHIKGDYAYITTNSSAETMIVDITNRESPLLAGTIETHSWSLAGKGNYLYFKSGSEPLLYVYDIADPIDPVLVNSCTTSVIGADYMEVSGDYLYTCSPGGVSIYDISDPVNPILASNLPTSGWPMNLSVEGNYAYISDNSSGIIADISDSHNPFITGSFTNISQVSDICVSGDYAYVPDNPYGFQVYNVSDPYNPILFDQYTGLEGTWFMELQNEFVYIEHYQIVDIFEIFDPGSLIPAASLSMSAPSGWMFSVVGDYIYLPCGQNLTILRFPVGVQGACDYATGDVNGSGNYNGLDITYAVAFFKGGPPPPYECECTPGDTWYVSGDVNESCSFNGLDVTYGIAYFKGGPAPGPCADCPPAE